MKKTITALCVIFVAGCQHASEVLRLPTYDPCFVHPVGTEFLVSCSWTGKSDFDMKKCIEGAGIPVTETVRPGETNRTYSTAIGPADSGEAIRRANAMRYCISKDM